MHDAAGRLIRLLVDEVREPGEHGIAWDGRSSDGLRMASGSYFARLEIGGHSRSLRLVLVD